MAKSRQSPALFDLLNEGETTPDQKLRVPGWWSRSEDSPTVQPVAPERPLKLSGAGLQGEVEQDNVVPVNEGGVSNRFSLIEIDDNRVKLSLSSVSAAVVVFVLALALIGVFELGRSRGEKLGVARGYEAGRASYLAEVDDAVDAARLQPADSGPIQSLLTEPAAARRRAAGESGSVQTDAVAGADGWVRDHTYIVVQEFRGDRAEDAIRAQDFLAESGIATAAVPSAAGSIQVITRQGFNRGLDVQRRQADELLKRVHALGEQYFGAGGGYRLQGYFKTLKGDNW